MTQSLASVSSITRDVSWDDLNTESTTENTVTEDLVEDINIHIKEEEEHDRRRQRKEYLASGGQFGQLVGSSNSSKQRNLRRNKMTNNRFGYPQENSKVSEAWVSEKEYDPLFFNIHKEFETNKESHKHINDKHRNKLNPTSSAYISKRNNDSSTEN